MEGLVNMAVKEITVQELQELDDVALIDVREMDEWAQGYIDGAVHVPLSALMENPSIFSRPEGKHCVLYCKGGVRSMKAAEILEAFGEKDLINLIGGYMAWQQQ